MRPYGVFADLVRRACGDTRPYGVSAGLHRRAHTMRPYGAGTDLVRRADEDIGPYGGNGAAAQGIPPEATCPARGG